MKYIVTLNGKQYEVEVEQGQATAVYTGPAQIAAAEGAAGNASETAGAMTSAAGVGAGTAGIAASGATAGAAAGAGNASGAAGTAAAAQVPTAAPAGDGAPVSSPMPGTIMDVRCQVGQKVKSGDILFILEAMKMENEIVAPNDGVITAVTVNKGAAVDTGSVLCTLK